MERGEAEVLSRLMSLARKFRPPFHGIKISRIDAGRDFSKARVLNHPDLWDYDRQPAQAQRRVFERLNVAPARRGVERFLLCVLEWRCAKISGDMFWAVYCEC